MNDISSMPPAVPAWASASGAFLRGFRHRTAIIKADDLGRELQLDPWWRLLDGLADRGVPISAGVVPSSLRKHGDAELGRLVLQLRGGGNEIWNHSHGHRDYARLSAAEQADDLRLAQDGIEDIFALRPTLFGAPFNAMNEATIGALEANGDFTGVYFARFPTRLETLDYNALCPPEFVRGYYRQPDFAEFLPRYQRRKAARPMVLQIHPPAWSRHGLQEFLRIVDWMIAEDWQFATFADIVERRRRQADPEYRPASPRAALLAADEEMTHAFGRALERPVLPDREDADFFFERYTTGTAKLAHLLRSASFGGAAGAGSDGPAGLDLGCGVGNWSVAYAALSPRHRAVGIDSDAYLTALAGEAAAALPMGERLTFRTGSALAIPAAEASFDHVICHNMLNYVPAPSVLQEIRRVLKPGGLALLGVQNRHFWLKGFLDRLRQGNLSGALARIDQLGWRAAVRCGLPTRANYATIREEDELPLLCDVAGLRPQTPPLALGERAGHFLGTPLFDHHLVLASSALSHPARAFVDSEKALDFDGLAALWRAGGWRAFLAAVEEAAERSGRSTFAPAEERVVAGAVALAAFHEAEAGPVAAAVAARHAEFGAAAALHLGKQYGPAAERLAALAAGDAGLVPAAAMALYAAGQAAEGLRLAEAGLGPREAWSEDGWMAWLTLLTAAEGAEAARAGLAAYLERAAAILAGRTGGGDAGALLDGLDLNAPMRTDLLALASARATAAALA